MHQTLKLGIPDDEAATAPSQRYKTSERKSVWLSRLLVPFAMGIWGFFANKLVATELSEARKPPVPPKPMASEDEDFSVTGRDVKAPNGDLQTDANSQQSNVVSFSDHPVTAASRSARSLLDAGDSLKIDEVVAGLRGRSFEPPDLSTRIEGGDFEFSEVSNSGNNTVAKGTEASPAPDRRTEVKQVSNVGTLRTNETMVLTAAMLLAQTPELRSEYLSVIDVEAGMGSITSLGEDMWLFVPLEGFEGDAEIRFELSDGIDVYQRTLIIEYDDTVADLVGTDDSEQHVTSTTDDDVLVLGGDDLVYSREGEDIVLGQEGDDVLIGGDGNDTLYGNEGNDYLFGRMGDDVLLGGAGQDTIYGGEGDDIAIGGDGGDYLLGENGNDRLVGGEGGDTLSGGLGADVVDGGRGDDEFLVSEGELSGDVIRGGAGSDSLVFTSSRSGVSVDLQRETVRLGDEVAEVTEIENIFGSLGDDEIIADDASNVFAGGGGDDRFVFENVGSLLNNGHARDVILDFDVGDQIDLSKLNLELGTLLGLGLHFAGLGQSNELGALSYHFEARDTGSDRTVVSARYMSDDEEDLDTSQYIAFELEGYIDLQRSDFVLTIDDMQS